MQKRFLSLLLILTLILSTPIYSYAQSGKSLPAPENVNVYYDKVSDYVGQFLRACVICLR